jgi:hypothetical protein
MNFTCLALALGAATIGPIASRPAGSVWLRASMLDN